MSADDSSERSAAIVWDLASRYEWLPVMVIARVVRQAALTLAMVNSTPPDDEAISEEAAQRLDRATHALLVAASDKGLTLRESPRSIDTASG